MNDHDSVFTLDTEADTTDDTSGGIHAAIAFLVWVIAFAVLAISPAVVWAAWGWFL